MKHIGILNWRMKTLNLKFHNIIGIQSQPLVFPQVTVRDDLQQNVLFTSIGTYKLPTSCFEEIIDIFSDKKYYLEFAVLNSEGIQKGNLGSIRNQLTQNIIFQNPTKFLNVWQRYYQDFAMQVLFAFAPLSIDNTFCKKFLVCNIMEGNWSKKVKEYVGKHF